MSKKSADKELNFRTRAKSWLSSSFNKARKPYYILSSLFLAATLFYITPSEWMPKELSIDKASDHYKIFITDKLLPNTQKEQILSEENKEPGQKASPQSQVLKWR